MQMRPDSILLLGMENKAFFRSALYLRFCSSKDIDAIIGTTLWLDLLTSKIQSGFCRGHIGEFNEDVIRSSAYASFKSPKVTLISVTTPLLEKYIVFNSFWQWSGGQFQMHPLNLPSGNYKNNYPHRLRSQHVYTVSYQVCLCQLYIQRLRK